MNRIAKTGILLTAGLIIASFASAGTFRFTEEDTEAIVGEVQKPDVTVVISRENLNKPYDLDLEESFLQKIIDSVESDPF